MGTPYTPPGTDPTGHPGPQPHKPTPATPTAPKKSWWKKALDQIGNAIAEAKFGQ